MSMRTVTPRERSLQPNAIESYQVRAEMLRRLISSRASVLLIYAPSLYGKTVLARQYAEATVGCDRAAWIDASQPFFMRHLIEGTLVEYCHSLCSEPRLAVFDGLPRLGERMMRSFLEALEVLYLECDVLITSRNDEFANACTLETCIVRGSDLLLGIDEVRQFNPARASEFPLYPAWRKVPGLFFGTTGERIIFEEKLVEAARRGEMEPAEALALFFGSADVKVFQRFFRDDIWDVIAPLELDSPHCGFSSEADVFTSFPISDTHRIDVLKGAMPALLDSSSFDDSRRLSEELISALIESGRDEFALTLTLSLHDRSQIEGFLASYGNDYLLRGRAEELVRLIEGGLNLRELDVFQLGLYAESLLLCNRRAEALRAWEEMANRASSTKDSCFAWLRILENDERDFDAKKERFLELAQAFIMEEGEPNPGYPCGLTDQRKAIVVWAQRILSSGKMLAPEFASFMEKPSDVLEKMTVLSSYLEVARTCCDHEIIRVPKKLKLLKQVLFRICCQEVGELPPNRFEPAIKLNIDALFGKMPAFELPSDFVKRAEVVAGGIPLYASAYRAIEYEEQLALDEPDEAKAGVARLAEGMVGMRFFGRFEVRTCDKILIDGTNQSRNIKRLLGMLAARRGSVVSREWVGKVLWPNAEPRQARKSFYNLCAAAKGLLQADGLEGSVLLMDMDSIWLDSGRVATDLDELNCLLQQMSGCDYAASEAARMLAAFDRFKGVFLEGVDDAEIKSIRQGYENRKAEALMVAGEYLYGKGELRLAKRYVTEVLDVSGVREDACYLMMRILRDLGQYAQAIRTYLDCRRELVEEIGIDGPIRLEQLYRELIGQ